jgi:5-deoxy-glucuronate isomerase
VPAHKHDTFRPQVESVHEELYYFRTDPPNGWGVERVYDPDGRDELLLLQDRVVTLKPRGFHTVAAAPATTLYYAFVLSGPARALTPFVDRLQAGLTA